MNASVTEPKVDSSQNDSLIKSADESVSFTSVNMDSTPQNNVGMIRVTSMEKKKKKPTGVDSNAVKGDDSDDDQNN